MREYIFRFLSTESLTECIIELSYRKTGGDMKKDLLSITDLSKNEMLELFDIASKLKKNVKNGIEHHYLKGKALAMIYEKPSLRTRVTFEIGIYQLGGYGIYLAPSDIKLGKRESVADVARNLSRWVDGIMARTFSHNTIVELAENASIPVINGLSDYEHPCQILADYLTILEHKNRVDGLKLAFIGDGNNVANSLLYASAILGSDFSIASPVGYEINPSIFNKAKEIADRTGVKLLQTNSPEEAVQDADIIYADVWTSMGEEAEREERIKRFKKYQVNNKLLEYARKDVIVMHCLPAHRGEEITSDVLDGPHSVVLDESENRLHIQKAILVKLMGSVL